MASLAPQVLQAPQDSQAVPGPVWKISHLSCIVGLGQGLGQFSVTCIFLVTLTRLNRVSPCLRAAVERTLENVLWSAQEPVGIRGENKHGVELLGAAVSRAVNPP